MPNVSDGLEENPESVNSQEGFDAALRAQVAPEETEPAEEQERDDSGRFAASEVETPEAPEEQTPPAEEAQAEESIEEPEAQVDWEERYKNAESLIGKQGNELGEARKLLQEQAERLARLEGQMEAGSQQVPMPLLDPDELAEQGSVGAQWAWDNAPELYERVIQSWAEENEEAARLFHDFKLREWESQQAVQEPEAPAAPEADPFIEQLKAREQIGQAIQAARTSMGDADWAIVKDHLIPALEGSPKRIQQAVVEAFSSEDPSERTEGVEALVDLARSRAITAATAQASTERQAQAKDAKQAAQVATGSQRPVTPGQAGELSREEALNAFREEILKTEDTSVEAGLTFGKA